MRRPFWAIFFCSLGFKLWLTAPISLNAIYFPHDYANFLEHGKHILAGEWFGPYDDLTLIKGPMTPLYVALLRQFDVSVPLAHQLLYAIASYLVCVAIRPLVRNGVILGMVFTFVLFDPLTFDFNAWVLNRSQLIDSLALIAVGSAMGIVVRAKASPARLIPWFVLVGLATTAVVMTREDTIWIYPPIVLLLATFAWAARSKHGSRPYRLALVVIPPLVYLTLVTTISTINEAKYGWRTTVETTSPEFISAYQSYTRIVVPGVDPRAYNAPREARSMAARVSPAAAELQATFDPGENWQHLACGGNPSCNDIPAAWTIWAMRDAVQAAGHYASGADARSFYIRLSREIDAACADGRLHCTAKGFGLAPPLRWADLPVTLSYAFLALKHAATFDQFALGGPLVMNSLDVAILPDYESVAGSADGRVATYEGWLAHRGLGHVSLDAPADEDYFNFTIGGSADVRAAIGHIAEYRDDDTANARFEITTTCYTNCYLVVDDGGTRTARIPLNPQTVDFHSPGILYHVDKVVNRPPIVAADATKNMILADIAITYQQLMPPCIAFVIVVGSARLWRFYRGRRSTRSIAPWTLIAGAGVAIIAHCFMLGLVCAISFNALITEYEVSLGALFVLLVALALSTEGYLLVRFVRRKLPARARISDATQ